MEERRVARERERLHQLALEEPEKHRHSTDDKMNDTKGTAVLGDTTHSITASNSFGRGRGLADLLGKQDADSAAKRQQQLELKVRRFEIWHPVE